MTTAEITCHAMVMSSMYFKPSWYFQFTRYLYKTYISPFILLQSIWYSLFFVLSLCVASFFNNLAVSKWSVKVGPIANGHVGKWLLESHFVLTMMQLRLGTVIFLSGFILADSEENWAPMPCIGEESFHKMFFINTQMGVLQDELCTDTYFCAKPWKK